MDFKVKSVERKNKKMWKSQRFASFFSHLLLMKNNVEKVNVKGDTLVYPLVDGNGKKRQKIKNTQRRTEIVCI